MSREPNTVDKSVECPNCGRSISAKSQELLDKRGCVFCRSGESDD